MEANDPTQTSSAERVFFYISEHADGERRGPVAI
jgi:hypothetical protein